MNLILVFGNSNALISALPLYKTNAAISLLQYFRGQFTYLLK